MKLILLMLIPFLLSNTRNLELADIYSQSASPESEHNKALMYITPFQSKGSIYKPYLNINWISPNELEILIPQNLNIQKCQISPQVERVRIIDNLLQDKIIINKKSGIKLKLSCEGLNKIGYFFVTFKEQL